MDLYTKLFFTNVIVIIAFVYFDDKILRGIVWESKNKFVMILVGTWSILTILSVPTILAYWLWRYL